MPFKTSPCLGCCSDFSPQPAQCPRLPQFTSLLSTLSMAAVPGKVVSLWAGSWGESPVGRSRSRIQSHCSCWHFQIFCQGQTVLGNGRRNLECYHSPRVHGNCSNNSTRLLWADAGLLPGVLHQCIPCILSAQWYARK